MLRSYISLCNGVSYHTEGISYGHRNIHIINSTKVERNALRICYIRLYVLLNIPLIAGTLYFLTCIGGRKQILLAPHHFPLQLNLYMCNHPTMYKLYDYVIIRNIVHI